MAPQGSIVLIQEHPCIVHSHCLIVLTVKGPLSWKLLFVTVMQLAPQLG